MRSQIYYQCLASANSPLALVRQGLHEFIYGQRIAASKLVLGVPWYGYRYACMESASSPANDICALKAVREPPLHPRSSPRFTHVSIPRFRSLTRPAAMQQAHK